ncbi:MAG TPA: hypothetical protein VFS43_17015 [Polyangiaceae bacterium]|nr:hypothetical protein [Polyangiaceae bacterium]
MYATVADARAEGITPAQADDARLLALLEDAARTLDALLGWWFEPRPRSFRLDGRGTPSLEPPVPPLRLDRLALDPPGGGAPEPLPLDPRELAVVGAPVDPGFTAPRLTLRGGRRFPRGDGNVLAEGLWGYTEADGTPLGRTPAAIKRATLLLVVRRLTPLGLAGALDDPEARGRVVRVKTRDQEIEFAPPETGGRPVATGDAEIDRLLAPYRRPSGLGAA